MSVTDKMFRKTNVERTRPMNASKNFCLAANPISSCAHRTRPLQPCYSSTGKKDSADPIKIWSCENRNAASRKGVTSHREALDLIKHKAALHGDRCRGLQIDLRTVPSAPMKSRFMKAAYEARLLTWASSTEMIQSPSLLQRQLST